VFGAVRNNIVLTLCALLFLGAKLALCNEPSLEGPPGFSVPNGFSVPDGFSVAIAADDSLVHDAFCMTLDSQGRPVVSGPGYVRTLIDDDKDGSFDRQVTWAKLPNQGAQGLWAEENKLYWVGDKGLWRSEDANGDLIADGQPFLILPLPTGGEHDSHAIRRGPDGYWYLIVGNYAADIQKINNDRNAAVKKPRAGTIWRISPDFSRRGAWAHGLRNAYDFDFLANGQIVTFDSDEEREVALPWYRPTRVLVVSPGADAGWLDHAWFDMDNRLTMPQVISKLGRGSPTGVAVYHHQVFPEKYREAAFVLDWTFGRVVAIFPQPPDTRDTTSSSNRFMAETFMQATGTAGFAPTDICVEPDGSLLICVGGRGTTGALYRIRYDGEPSIKANESLAFENATPNEYTDEQLAALASIVSMPCPWESWSSSQWIASLDTLPPNMLEELFNGRLSIESSNPRLSSQWRRRAAQMLLFAKKNPQLDQLRPTLQSECSVTASAAWWLLGHCDGQIPKELAESIENVFSQQNPSSTKMESAWDQLLGGLLWRQQHESLGLKNLPFAISAIPGNNDWQRQNAFRQIQLWAISRTPQAMLRQVSSASSKTEPIDNLIARNLFGSGAGTVDASLMDRLAMRASSDKIESNPQAILEALTLLQASLGDLRHSVPLQQSPPQVHATDGYRSLYSRKVPEDIREGWSRWCMSLVNATAHPDDVVIENEVLRTIAMFEPTSPSVIDFCLARIGESSHPTSDLHVLTVLACCKGKRDKEQSEATARALPALLTKVKTLGLNTDNSWSKRLEQIFKQLVQNDPALPGYLSQSEQSIEPNTIFWMEWCPRSIQATVRTAINTHLSNLPIASWPEELVRFASQDTVDLRLVKKLRDEATRPPTYMILEMLSKSPSLDDYPLMVSSLCEGTRDLWPMAWKSLTRMPSLKPDVELRALAILWMKLKNEPIAEISTTALLTRIRSNAWKLKLPNVPSNEKPEEWLAFFDKNLDASTLELLNKLNGPPADWLPIVKESSSFSGDAARGEALFQRAKCSQCHGGGNALGPSLTGISRRFSHEDLFRSIFEPSRDISDRYQSMKVLTTDGEVLVGMKVYESTDGVTLQAADGKLLRINQADIESKSNSPISIMSNGLLQGASASDIADLYAFMKQL